VTEHDLERAAMRRVSLRLLPFLFLLYTFAYLDRMNVGFAGLQMNTELKFNATVFGFGAGIFFIGYALFEVPSNLILARVGARRWLARIAITWGLLACAMTLVRTPAEFYAVRFLLGVAEAGFFPGVVYYLGLWFPQAYRARAMAGFMIAIPLSQALGGPLGGTLLGLDGLGRLSGWQWLFLVEGLPSVLLGLVVLGYLTERPADAGWLDPAQRRWLVERLEHERRRHPDLHVAPLQALGNPVVWLLAAPYFAYYTVAVALTFWTPTLVREALGTSNAMTGLVAGGISLIAAGVYPLAGALSDRRDDRCGVAALGLALGCAGCIGVALLPASPLRVLGLLVMALLSPVFMSSFWCLPTRLLNGTSAAAGIALISAIGSSGGFFGPSIVGFLKHSTHSDSGAFFGLAALACAGAVVILALRRMTVFRPGRAHAIESPARLA
jgi:ACS family tartrate transporter-like MFS transporter